MKMFAVAGRPILHSKSPLIFARLFERSGVQAAYGRLSVASSSDLLDLARRLGLDGLNVTSPLKQSLLPSLDETDGEARRIGAVNTVVRRDGLFRGYNTDPAGVLNPLQDKKINPGRKKILLLGAGGAARAALAALRPFTADITVINRTWDKALACVETFGGTARPWPDLRDCLKKTDLLINTIPPAAEVLSAEWLPRRLIVFNAAYQDSTFNARAARRGCQVIPGEWWLYHQALKSFSLFLDCPAPPAETHSRLFSPVYGASKRLNVALIGFMGSGKTTIGRLLAGRTGFNFLDTDEMVSGAEGLSVGAIFARHGEAYFRAKEKEAVAGLAKNKRTVMACGGGAVLDADNRKILESYALVIWLSSSIPAIVSRVRDEDRPLLAGGDLQERVRQLMAVRHPDYFRTADLIIDADRDAEEVARNIHEEICSTIGS
jgi:shikimate dehydrogenase